MVDPKPCRCGSTTLQAKWDSDAGVGWVHCDRCGAHSTPVPLPDGREAIIAQWNKEVSQCSP